MSLHCPENEEELIAYTERKLGYDKLFPDETNEVDLTETQKLDLVYDALRMWHIYAEDGTKNIMMVIQTKKGQTDYQLPKNIFAVQNYIPATVYSNMFSLDYQLRQEVGYNLNFALSGGQPATSVEIVKQNLALIELKFGKKWDFTYNASTHTLTILAGVADGGRLVLICSAFTEDAAGVFSHPWILRYTEALFLRQWATNFRQFNGVKLPGGITINWESMLGDANQRIKELEEELVTHYSRPVCMQRG